MSPKSPRIAAASVLAVVTLALPPCAEAEDAAKKLGWASTAELSYVMTAGNAESTTWGLADKSIRTWQNALLTLKAGGLRAESTTFTRTALETTPGHFDVTKTSTTAVTGEAYNVGGQYDRNVTERFFWNAFAGWDRNRFAGIDNRYTAGGGVGNIWRNDDRIKFRTDYSATYTRREDVVPDPSRKENFAGIRVASDYQQKIGASTTYVNTTVLDDNVSDTSDWRGDMINSIAVSMSSKLALKASLRWVYYNKPALVEVPVVDAGGVPTGASVKAELDSLDTIFTTSLVINW